MADQFLVVGIGASAGGVEALQAFFAPMPPNPGIAFIVITHLGEGRESALPQIIARSTTLPVTPIRDGDKVEPNHIYVLSENVIPTARGGQLWLRPQPAGGRDRNVIDVFLSSLSEDWGEHAAAVILSGTGHDGTLGVSAIKERDGLTMAQSANNTAPRYADMPSHAIASGAIDLRLGVEDMAGKLVEYAQNIGNLDTENETSTARREQLEDARRAICDILRDEIGHDFSGYKERTFLRRVERRMQVLELPDIREYIARLRDDRQEMSQLFNDLLIGVTAFFRDKEVFDALSEQVIPRLFEGKTSADAVRVWVPGCATGEEAYSIAILLLEQAAKAQMRPKMVVFASDIDDPAIAVARAARYPAAMLQAIPAERIDRFFIGDGVSYTPTKEVRDICIFSSHSIIRDPPFSRIDLISCRNLLIYLDKELQHQLIPVFHYALRPGGYLFLGTSETLTQHTELFAALDKKNRFFQRRDHIGSQPGIPLLVPSPRLGMLEPRPSLRNYGTALPVRHLVESRILEQFAPAHVVVTRDGDVIHFSARTGKYLENASGAPSRNVIAMARRGLRIELRTALHEAVETRHPAQRSGIRVQVDDRIQFLDLLVEPLPDADVEPLFLIVFSDFGTPLAPEQLMPLVGNEREGSTEQIERELRETRERLQSLVEEYETALEELKSANEELVSINEELQSTNEELETSREEAQSINEELQTVNNELQRKVEDLDRANDNLRNLFEGTEIATVVVDRNLGIRSFTPAMRSVFNLMESDRGRPLTDIVSEIVDLDLQQEVKSLFLTGLPHERRVVCRDGKAHYLMRVLPYRTADKILDGAVITFTDISRIIEIEQYQEEINTRVETALGAVLGIVRQGETGEAGSPALVGRVEALAGIHRLITRTKWGKVALDDLAANELVHFGIGREGRVSMEGPLVSLHVGAAVGIGMSLHELATNSAAHGALSTPQGRVQLSWEIDRADSPEERLVVHWRESGGPPVEQPGPAGDHGRRIEAELMEKIGGTATLTYSEADAATELVLPLSSGLVLQPVADEDKQAITGLT